MLIKNRTKKETKLNRYAELLCKIAVQATRSISIAQLNTLLHLHLRPIKLVVYERPYTFEMWDISS